MNGNHNGEQRTVGFERQLAVSVRSG